jgi:hypothetical protein
MGSSRTLARIRGSSSQEVLKCGGVDGGVQLAGSWVLMVRDGFSFLRIEVKTERVVSTPRDCARIDSPFFGSFELSETCFFFFINLK